MFMDHNRAINGAPRPSQTASEDARAQDEQETLSPNDGGMDAPQRRTFEPNLETEEAINRRHYRGGLDEGEWPGYEHMVPHGPQMGR